MSERGLLSSSRPGRVHSAGGAWSGRAPEGGADNDEVFNFGWFNFAVIGARYRF